MKVHRASILLSTKKAKFPVSGVSLGAAILFCWLPFTVAQTTKEGSPETKSAAADKQAKSKAAYEKGRKQAHEELAQHTLAIQQFGLPAPWVIEYVNRLRTDYHINVRMTGCVITEESISFQQGFNAVMMDEIEKQYGKDMLPKVAAESRKRYEASLSAPAAAGK